MLLLVIYAPDPRTDPQLETAEALCRRVVKGKRKPVLTVWMGDKQVRDSPAANYSMKKVHSPITRHLKLRLMLSVSSPVILRNQQLLLQIPYPLSKNEQPDIAAAREIILR